jgi:polyhydroxyalkanoate synthesis regulator phasin
MSMFEQEIQHPDPIVSETAVLLQQFTDQLHAGQMTEDEYKQLVGDLLDMQRIDQLTTDIWQKNEIAKAFQRLYQIVSTMVSFI